MCSPLVFSELSKKRESLYVLICATIETVFKFLCFFHCRHAPPKSFLDFSLETQVSFVFPLVSDPASSESLQLVHFLQMTMPIVSGTVAQEAGARREATKATEGVQTSYLHFGCLRTREVLFFRIEKHFYGRSDHSKLLMSWIRCLVNMSCSVTNEL